MSSIIDAFNDAFSERLSFIKFGIYAIPVYFCLKFYITGQMNYLYSLGTVAAILLLALFTQAIYNVRQNRREILSFNPIELAFSLAKSVVVLLPNVLVFGFVGKIITENISIPIDLPHVDLIFDIIVWSIVFSIILTSYLCFTKYLNIRDGFNYKVIFSSFVDVFLGILFFIPQLALANVFIIGPFAYLFWLFHVPFTNWGFIVCCSIAIVVNISIIANYFAQFSYEAIVSSDEDKDDYQITKIIEDIDQNKAN